MFEFSDPPDDCPCPYQEKEVVLGLVVGLLAIAFTLVLGEVAVRVISRQKLIYNIEMVKYATDLKMRDPKGEVSHVHRPSSSAHLMGVDVSLNSLGDRGPELPATRDSSKKRVLVMGSSITMGWGVPFESTFTSTTERLLNTRKPFGPATSFELVNAGIGNYNTIFQHALFERQFPVVKPDLVVVHYFISDVQPRGKGRDSFILRNSFLAAFLFDRYSQVKLRFNHEYKDLFTFYNDLYADSSSAWKQTQKEILQMRDESLKGGAQFVVMVVPDIHDLSPGTPYKALYQKIADTFTANGIATVSAFEPMQQAFGSDVTKLWIQADDPHPNARGHAVMANVMYDYLAANDPLHLRGAAPAAAAH